MKFIQGTITRENMWTELGWVLDGIDADFTGTNGEEYYANNGISHMENAIEKAEKFECDKKKIEFVIGECKEYNTWYYNAGFEYTVIDTNNGNYEVVIAVCE